MSTPGIRSSNVLAGAICLFGIALAPVSGQEPTILRVDERKPSSTQRGAVMEVEPRTTSPMPPAVGMTGGTPEKEQLPVKADADSGAVSDPTRSSVAPTTASALKSIWSNGVQLESADKAFRMHVGGLIHVDAGWWNAGDSLMYGPGGVGPLNDGANFRRARLHSLGSMYDTVVWAFEVGFENRLPQFFNVYAEVPQLPYDTTFRVGHFREPFGMDALTSYNNLTFLERSLPLEPLVPFFNTGVMFYGPLINDRATFATGMFRSNSDAFNAADAGDGTYAYTTRLTANPINGRNGASILHLAAAYSYRVLPFLDAAGVPVASGGLRRVVLAARPEVRVNAPAFVSTGVITADREQLVGVELGVVQGPFLVQAEYMGAVVGNAVIPGGPATRGDVYFQGLSVQASWFLTGEVRPYVRREGIFGQVRPRTNFRTRRNAAEHRTERGFGAWELATRYSRLDLNSEGIRGGDLHDFTIGLNWYLNPQVRVLWNHVLIWRNAANPGSSGFAQAFTMRCQLEF